MSYAFVEDWLVALQAHCTPEQLRRFLSEIDLQLDSPALARVTHDQIVRLYQLVALETGDEMMGLWSRPIRSGALKHICESVRAASSLSAAMYRFVTFWNLLLDDHQLSLEESDGVIRVVLTPRPGVTAHRFGHMLMLKLAHGIASWLIGEEIALAETAFVFERPEFAEDYSVLFPSSVRFGEPHSLVGFHKVLGRRPITRTNMEMYEFLVRAPRDWIFTSLREHTLALRVRETLLDPHGHGRLHDTARRLNISPRTLIRRLDADGTSFQRIRDGVRRDLAIRELAHTDRSIESIAHHVGFTSASNFHRAFKRWTGSTPGSYRSP